MKVLIVKMSFACGLLVACSSKPDVVNYDPTFPILPMVPIPPREGVHDYLGRSPTTALEGKVLSDNEIPFPLANVLLGLYRQEKNNWQEVTQFISSSNGSFRITQKLTKGLYEIRVLDSRFKGSLQVNLDTKPLEALILTASKK